MFRKKGLKDMSLDLEFNFKIDKPISVISREIRKFFKGKKKLILSWNNEVYYKIKKIEISEISSELKKIGLFTVSFILDPYSYLISNLWLDITSLKEINNIYDLSLPLLRITGYGNINIQINTNQISLKSVSGIVIIDGENMLCYTSEKLNFNKNMTGYYPEIIEGKNTLSFEGNITKIELLPNWRYL
ncbi:hypothetical protein OEG88_06165 [Clostridium perfringens]|uniref:hypothetical protein n=1 Tax=Clostridium perfringens TaxID=1502 RepID=UPI001A29BB96|nr:hypothetical protein [Clostridium perfringens]MDM1003178.1 hypothetical protein [Clostridium perfringens]UYC94153.1 hypothetical protein OEG88_06165 [Clostridium perfringens]HAT4156189.1 hypothetical protein [Clostridium perfringens]